MGIVTSVVSVSIGAIYTDIVKHEVHTYDLNRDKNFAAGKFCPTILLYFSLLDLSRHYTYPVLVAGELSPDTAVDFFSLLEGARRPRWVRALG